MSASTSTSSPVAEIRLVPFRPEMTAWWAEGPAVFEARTGLQAGEAAPWIGQVLAMTRAPECDGPGGGWYGFWGVDGNAVVGTCAHASRVDPEGWVEIAYFTFPPFERSGYGRAMAARVLASASERIPGARAIAKTLPMEGPSTRILKGVGMRRVGSVTDAEHGEVWLWQSPEK
jgi:ribosomal-protein-alanine N-acetyltransferase